MKLKGGSSSFFIVAAVLFEDHEEAQGCDARISELRGELGVADKFEFHFNSCNDRFRESFLKAVAPFGFFYHGIVLNKRKLWGEGFKHKDSFYKYTTGLVFENAKPHLKAAIVILDKCGDREFRGQLSKYLKRKMNEAGAELLIRKVKMEASHSNNLLQLADMVCGAIYRSFNLAKANRRAFRQIISHRELRVQVWPK